MPNPAHADLARLRITCPDRPGIVAAVSTFLRAHGANITALDQHSTDPEAGVFFMRAEFTTPHLDLSRPALEAAFARVVAEPFAMTWSLDYAARERRFERGPRQVEVRRGELGAHEFHAR
ncbi:MAG: ACT domain-containing protein, partial [Bacteroidota bacterium]